MSSFGLVIFDCDGVLVDSERISNTVFAEMLNELGLSVSLQHMFDVFVGHSMASCMELVKQMLGAPAPDDFVSAYKRRIKAALQKELRAVTGIEDVLEGLNLPYCVASNSAIEIMRAELGKTGLLPRFENKLYSVEHVPRGKPHPDVFLYAAQQMGVRPSRCLVIEDTPIGVQAGVAAGMTVFGYAELMKAEKLLQAGASRIVKTMSNMLACISAFS